MIFLLSFGISVFLASQTEFGNSPFLCSGKLLKELFFSVQVLKNSPVNLFGPEVFSGFLFLLTL